MTPSRSFRSPRTLLLFTAALAIATTLGGCGGDDEAASSQPETASAPAVTESADRQPNPGGQAPATQPKRAEDAVQAAAIGLGSPSEVPRPKGGDTSIQDFGAEASEPERLRAGRTVAAFFAAYAAGHAATACALLSAGTRGQLGEATPEGCVGFIEAGSERLKPASRRALRAREILSLRLQGQRAFAIYRTGDGTVMAIPLARGGGGWQLGALAGLPLA